MSSPTVVFHRFRDPDLLLRASIRFPSLPNFQIRLAATDGQKEYILENLHNQHISRAAESHGYNNCSFSHPENSFNSLVLYVLFHIQPPPDVPIPEGVCILARKPTTPERCDVELGLRPLAAIEWGCEFPAFAVLSERKGTVELWRWADGAVAECMRLYRAVAQGGKALEETEKLRDENRKLKVKVEMLIGEMEMIDTGASGGVLALRKSVA